MPRIVAGVSRKTYEYHRARAMAAGTWQPYVPAQPVRDHIAALKAAGFGEGRISELSGIRSQTIAFIVGRGRKMPEKVRPETATAILAVDPATSDRAELSKTDSMGTLRRIQALCCLGWPVAELERMAGRPVGSLDRVSRQPQVTLATARLVRELYDRLSMTPAPAGRHAKAVARKARSRGWAPPLAWDDDCIDDPGQLPAAVGDGDRLRVWLANYRTLEAQGSSREQISARMGVPGYAISERMRRAFEFGLISELADMDAPKVRELEPCGTRAAYARHYRRGEKPCAACRAANIAYLKARDGRPEQVAA